MKVVHCKKNSYDVYIGRPSKWGNPFSHKDGTIAKFKVTTRAEAITKYRDWILTSEEAACLRESFNELENKILGCWCYPKKCHGNVLVDILKNKCSNEFF